MGVHKVFVVDGNEGFNLILTTRLFGKNTIKVRSEDGLSSDAEIVCQGKEIRNPKISDIRYGCEIVLKKPLKHKSSITIRTIPEMTE